MESKKIRLGIVFIVIFIVSIRFPFQSAEGQNTKKAPFLERIGFFADIDIGYDIRFNGYSTYEPLLQNDIPVSFSTKELSVIDLSLETGLMQAPFVSLDYKSSIPRTDFQQQALAFREDNAKGLEKYTFGISTAPFWELVLPDETAGTIKWILSGKFRSVRELTQTSAAVDESSLFFTGMNNQSPTFDQAGPGDPYSFTTEYKYNSYTWPLISNLKYDDDRIKANFLIYIGYANWDFDRSYATFFPNHSDQVIYGADVNTDGVTAEMRINSRRNFEQSRKWGFSFNLVYGYGIWNDFKGKKGNLNKLFYPNEDRTIDIANQNYELEFSMKKYLFSASEKIDMYVKGGFDANLFWTSFEDYQEPGAEQHFSKIDYIITPRVEISISFL